MLCGTEPFPQNVRAKKYKLHQHFLSRQDFHHIMTNLPEKVNMALCVCWFSLSTFVFIVVQLVSPLSRLSALKFKSNSLTIDIWWNILAPRHDSSGPLSWCNWQSRLYQEIPPPFLQLLNPNPFFSLIPTSRQLQVLVAISLELKYLYLFDSGFEVSDSDIMEMFQMADKDQDGKIRNWTLSELSSFQLLSLLASSQDPLNFSVTLSSYKEFQTMINPPRLSDLASISGRQDQREGGRRVTILSEDQDRLLEDWVARFQNVE